MAPKSLTNPIPTSNTDREWKVKLNGKTVSDVTQLTIEHARFGVLTYGMTDADHDGWTFHEVNGGDVVVVFYHLLDERPEQLFSNLMVGLITEIRPNQGGEVMNAPRASVGKDIPHVVAKRLLAGEAGLEVRMSDIIELPGAPANPNSTFFETWGKGDGATFFAVRTSRDMLEHSSRGWRFDRNKVNPGAATLMAKKIVDTKFLPWQEAAQLGDMFTNAAVARLLAHLMPSASSSAARQE